MAEVLADVVVEVLEGEALVVRPFGHRGEGPTTRWGGGVDPGGGGMRGEGVERRIPAPRPNGRGEYHDPSGHHEPPPATHHSHGHGGQSWITGTRKPPGQGSGHPCPRCVPEEGEGGGGDLAGMPQTSGVPSGPRLSTARRHTAPSGRNGKYKQGSFWQRGRNDQKIFIG